MGDSIIAPPPARIGEMKISSLLGTIMICGIVSLSGCVYRMDIPQGNRIEASVIEQLQVGMSRSQVEFLMGTPAVVDLYRQDRWHYVYYLKTGDDGKVEKRHLTLTFSNDLLSSIDGSRVIF